MTVSLGTLPISVPSYTHITVKTVIVAFTKFDLLINEHFKNMCVVKRNDPNRRPKVKRKLVLTSYNRGPQSHSHEGINSSGIPSFVPFFFIYLGQNEMKH